MLLQGNGKAIQPLGLWTIRSLCTTKTKNHRGLSENDFEESKDLVMIERKRNFNLFFFPQRNFYLFLQSSQNCYDVE